MNIINLKELFNNDAVTAICWTLVHSLWQGAIFAAMAGLILMITKRSRPSFRYNILSALFFLLVITIACTYIYERANFGQLKSRALILQGSGKQSLVNAQAAATNDFAKELSIPQIVAQFLSKNAWLIVAIWFFIFTVKSIRVVFTLFYTRHLKTYKAHVPAPYWRDKIAVLCQQLQIGKAVTLLESEIIKIPVVFGHLKPVIFIPLGLLAHLAPEQVEAILIHELAHIRRSDYAVNLLQNMVDILFFFNPALLWLSSLIRNEREHCCDDIAIGQTHDKKQFIQALISFKQLSMSGTSSYLPAFPGNQSHILNRAARIVHNENKTLNSAEKAILLLCILLVSAFTIVPKAGSTVKHGLLYLKSNIMSIVSGAHEKPLQATSQAATLKRGKPELKLSAGVKDTTKTKHDSLVDIDLTRLNSKADLKHRDSLVTVNLERLNKTIPVKQRDSLSKIAFASINMNSSVRSRDSILNMLINRMNLGTTMKHQDSLLLFVPNSRARKRIDSVRNETKEQMRSVMYDLITEHVINDKNSLTSFALTNTELVVNGVKQPDIIHEKLKAKHLKGSQLGLFYGPLPAGMHNFSGIFYGGKL